MDQTKAEINVTPLVDVVLVLLIIFMVITPMITVHGIQVPQASHGKRASEKEEVQTISLAADGSVFWEEERVSPEMLTSRLTELAKRQPDSRLFVRADRRLEYGKVCRILSLASGHGFNNLALQVESKSPAKL